MPAVTVIRNGVIATACGLVLVRCAGPGGCGTGPESDVVLVHRFGEGNAQRTEYALQPAGGHGERGDVHANGTLKGAPATQWTIQLYVPKAGTWKNFAQENGEGPNVALIGATANGTTNWNWASETKNGKMTTTPTSGKVSITLVGYSSFRGKPGKGKVHLTGSWGCTS